MPQLSEKNWRYARQSRIGLILRFIAASCRKPYLFIRNGRILYIISALLSLKGVAKCTDRIKLEINR